jgi:hypothetical protein
MGTAVIAAADFFVGTNSFLTGIGGKGVVLA